MRDSGIPWAGIIPSHWKVVRAKYYFIQTNERGNKEPVLLASSQKYGICPQDWLDGVVKVSEEADIQKFKTIHKGDFVISLRSFQGGFEYSKFEGVCSPAYQVFHAIDSYAENYLRYLFKSEMFIDEMNSLTVGIRDGRNIKYEDFASSNLILPPYIEQCKIADYLDNECTKIDSIISDINATIEDYKKWKASIIYETVTKGLDPTVEMGDSGITSLGIIPRNWRATRIKYVSKLGPKCNVQLQENDMVSFVPMECVKNGYRVNKDSMKLNENNSYSKFENGDIAIAKVTPCFENGNICIMDNLTNGYGFGSSELFILRAHSIERKYLFYFLQSIGFVNGAIASMTGTGGLKRVSSYYINNAAIPLPSKEEQNRIVSFLDERCSALNEIIKEKESLMLDLESYKKSLIYEVVTGKRKVV